MRTTSVSISRKAPFEALYAWVDVYLPDVEAARARFDTRAATNGAIDFGPAGALRSPVEHLYPVG